jgi:hypothetical protein
MVAQDAELIAEVGRTWFEWSGWVLSLTGLAVSAIGLRVTFREAREASRRAGEAVTAAQAARAAAEDALRSVDDRMTMRDVNELLGTLRMVVALVDLRRVPETLVRVRLARERMVELHTRRGAQAHAAELQHAVFEISAFQQLLEAMVDARDPGAIPLDVPATQRMLHAHIDLFAAWGAAAPLNVLPPSP